KTQSAVRPFQPAVGPLITISLISFHQVSSKHTQQIYIYAQPSNASTRQNIMPPRRSHTISTTTSASATDPPDYGHYRRLVPRNPPDPSTGKVIKKKDPHWHTNRYLIPF